MLHLVRNASNIKRRFLIKMSDTINIRILLVYKITMMVSFMKKIIIALSISLLGGCVDMGRLGLHPTTKTAYFDGHPFQVESCLSVAAQDQRLYLEQDEPLPDGTRRYNLEQDDETVAWVEIAKFSHHQTSATFYYDPKASDISTEVSGMIARCKTSR